ncbi:Gag polyprotein, partial [Lemmus lemmus]
IYHWKTHNPPFSKDPLALTGLIESILLWLSAAFAGFADHRGETASYPGSKKQRAWTQRDPHSPPDRNRCSFTVDVSSLGLRYPSWAIHLQTIRKLCCCSVEARTTEGAWSTWCCRLHQLPSVTAAMLAFLCLTSCLTRASMLMTKCVTDDNSGTPS